MNRSERHRWVDAGARADLRHRRADLRRRLSVFAAVAVLLGLLSPAKAAESSGTTIRPWEPPPLRTPQYQLGPKKCPKPFTELAEQYGNCGAALPFPDHVIRVKADDGVVLHTEVWLPHATQGGPPVPTRVPVIASISPYHASTEPTYGPGSARDSLVTRGYAFAQVHLRGTGMSGGCWNVVSDVDAADGVRVVDALAAAPWSTGRVGLMGLSHDGGAALNVAAAAGRSRPRGVRAIVAGSPASTPADLRTRDGVLIPGLRQEQWAVIDTAIATAYRPNYFNAMEGFLPNPAERAGCTIDEGVDAASTQGGPTPWELERDLRAEVLDIAAPTLFTMGLQEVSAVMAPGLFDRIGAAPGGTKKKVGLFGQHGHSWPDWNSRRSQWARADWAATFIGWFDKWLLGIDNGAEDWPAVQVQDTTGQWRTEPDFPGTGGPVGHLPLWADGTLATGTDAGARRGVTVLAATAGNTSRIATTFATEDPPGTARSWQTPPLDAPLRVTGVPVLDAWVQTDGAGGQVVGELQAFDAKGVPLPFTRRVGARSLRYLEPIQNHRFVQTEPRTPPAGAFRVQVRFDPGDFVVPAGGYLRLELGAIGPVINGHVYRGTTGADAANDAYPDRHLSPPDPSGANVTILHECGRVSALRFLMHRPTRDLIDVREQSEVGPLPANSTVADDGPSDGGIASGLACGEAPTRLASFGSVR